MFAKIDSKAKQIAKRLILKNEGKRNRVYIDTVGVPTLGIGHALHEGSYVPDIVIQVFFSADFREACRLYHQANLDLDPVREAAVIDMFFNLGPQLLKWKFIEALREHDYEAAGEHMKDSKWWKQVKGRAPILHHMITTGEEIE